MANIQISQELFFNLIRYHLLDCQDPEIDKFIREGLTAKIDAMARRDAYSTYKTASTQEERDVARRKYLDSAGISDEFRW